MTCGEGGREGTEEEAEVKGELGAPRAPLRCPRTPFRMMATTKMHALIKPLTDEASRADLKVLSKEMTSLSTLANTT